MKVILPVVATTFLLSQFASAIYEEDVGILDFTVATSGHALTRFIGEPFEGSVITSDVPSTDGTKTSCYIASRDISDGSLLWRRNVCSASSGNHSHDVISLRENVYTVDDSGVVRAWTKKRGDLLWESRITPSSGPKIWTQAKQGMDFIIAASGSDVSIFHADSGKLFDDTMNVFKEIGHSEKQGEKAMWLNAISDPKEDGRIRAFLSFVDQDGNTSGNRMTMVELEIGNDKLVSSRQLNFVKGPIVASTIQISPTEDGWRGFALSPEGSLIHFSSDNSPSSKVLSPSQLSPQWRSLISIRKTAFPSVISVEGSDDENEAIPSLFEFDSSAGTMAPYGKDNQAFTAFGRCEYADLDVAFSAEKVFVYRRGEAVVTSGDIYVPDGDTIELFSIVECGVDEVVALLSTSRGTLTQLSFRMDGDTIHMNIGWSVEEGLGSVTSAVVLDASHLGVDDLVEEEEAVMRKLSFSSRISSQLSGILSSITGSKGGSNRRDHIFGFVKVAVLLSQTTHRVWGLSTSGTERGATRWSLDLPKAAEWHTLVHGTTNSPNALHGINGGTHSREILVLSSKKSSIEWKCIDGTTGAINSQDEVVLSSPIAQVLPIYGSPGGCRQSAVLLLKDKSLVNVPADAETNTLVYEHLRKTPNGLYTHILDKRESKLESYQITAESVNGLASRQIGQTSFAGERIVKIAYPIRDETLQSMSTVLGDDSLLLKYINPHLAVVITMTNEIDLIPTAIAESLAKQQNPKARKPAGAGEVVDQATQPVVPSMFVNVVDTVSGRVLHRSSHANVDPNGNIAVMISENWVLYSYINNASRRTELGVLTLHEGMIDKEGMTMFKTPVQTTTFSSFDARESKPVVLAKVYVYPKSISALGATATRGGVSSRKILIASTDGKVTAIDRNMIETRRPMGEVKEEEKKEGLLPYRELIPEVSLLSLSYNQTVESANSIISAYTSLESQSLVMAFGGPDIFFTRTSPSRGFDLLPDSFSRVLVSIVTIGLVVVVVVLKNRGTQQALKQGWL